MAGKFFEEDNKPFFETEEYGEAEILTSRTPGPLLRVDSNPTALYPGEYTYLGEITQEVHILSLVPGGDDSRVDVYQGEFTIASRNAQLIFPSSILLTENAHHYLLEPEYEATYQFRIVNGICDVVKVFTEPS